MNLYHSHPEFYLYFPKLNSALPIILCVGSGDGTAAEVEEGYWRGVGDVKVKLRGSWWKLTTKYCLQLQGSGSSYQFDWIDQQEVDIYDMSNYLPDNSFSKIDEKK